MSQRILTVEEKVAPYVVAALAVLTLVIIGTERFGSGSSDPTANALVFTASEELIFKDAADGVVIVERAADGSTVVELQAGEGGFTRTALRGLFYSRKMYGVGPEAPIVLARTEEGRVVLHDPATNKTIGINAFGDVNTAQLMALLDEEKGVN